MNIIKSDNDSRDYKLLKLDNKINVIIIKDKKSTQCGALLNINVGSIKDTIDGIAHFLEHMVFMGSKKYPDENNFMELVNKNGGYTNAMTGDTHTTYYFTIESTKFINILDVFANFFITPLLKKENMEREVNAVNAEAIKNTSDDNWILHDIIKKGMTSHPLNHFSCGNTDTLKGENLSDLVKHFFNQNYSSNIMDLIIFINDDIDEQILQKEIEDTFGKIENKNINIHSRYGKILNTQNLIKFIPNKDINVMAISIEVPKLCNDLISNPNELLYYILNNKGPNSLYQILDKKNYIISFGSGEFVTYDDYVLIIIELNLTDKGFTDYMKVYQIIIEYIQSIKNTSFDYLEKIYNNILSLDHRNYILSENSDIIETMLEFNYLLMNKIKPENILNWRELKPKYKALHTNFIKLIDSILDLNLNVIIGSKKFDGIVKCEFDKIYNIYYCIEKLSKIQIEKTYDIIKENKYISHIIPKLKKIKYAKNIEKIKTKNNYTFVYNFDHEYKTPLIDIFVTIKFPLISESVKTYVETLLYLNCAYSKYSEEISLINNAPYVLSLSLDQNMLYIYIQSDEDKINHILDVLFNILNYDKGKNFIEVKQKYYKSVESFKNELPMIKMNNLISKILEKDYYIPYDTIKIINSIEYNSCVKTFDKIKQKGITTIFISGNIQKENAIEISENIYSRLNIKEEIIEDNDGINNINTPFNKFMINHNDNEQNSIMVKLYEICRIQIRDKDWETYIIFLKLLNSMMYMKFFNKMRTQEKLGYIISTQINYLGNPNYKNGFFKLLIQSPVKNGKTLLEYTEKFIDDFYVYLNELNQEEFNEFKLGEISILKDKYNNLSEYNIYLYTHILDKSFMFDYNDVLIRAFDKFSLEQFIDLYDKLIIHNKKQYDFVIDSKKL
jgi:secreted Zn-dependent insulinase-like peptidase